MAKKKSLIKIVWVGVILYAGYVMLQQQIQLHKLGKEADVYHAQIAQQEEQKQDLEETVKMLETDEYYEKIARKKLGLVRPDEKVFVDTAN